MPHERYQGVALLQKLQPRVPKRRGGELADQDEAKSPVQRGAAERFMAIPIVTQQGDVDRAIVAAAVGQPALSGVACAVLLLGVVLESDKFRHQRDDVIQTRLHPHRGQSGMEITLRCPGHNEQYSVPSKASSRAWFTKR